jgi:predicted DNA-binding protein
MEKVLRIKVPDELLKKLERYCKKEHITVSYYARKLIEDDIKTK